MDGPLGCTVMASFVVIAVLYLKCTLLILLRFAADGFLPKKRVCPLIRNYIVRVQ